MIVGCGKSRRSSRRNPPGLHTARDQGRVSPERASGHLPSLRHREPRKPSCLGGRPECFSILGPRCAFPYKLDADDLSRGPMGYGTGKLQIIQRDGKGGLELTEHPFVVMRDRAYVDLGTIVGPLRQRAIRQSAAAAWPTRRSTRSARRLQAEGRKHIYNELSARAHRLWRAPRAQIRKPDAVRQQDQDANHNPEDGGCPALGVSAFVFPSDHGGGPFVRRGRLHIGIQRGCSRSCRARWSRREADAPAWFPSCSRIPGARPKMLKTSHHPLLVPLQPA